MAHFLESLVLLIVTRAAIARAVSDLARPGCGWPANPRVVVAKIERSLADFDTSPERLKNLKASGIPDSVILAMVKAS
jgi:hypothetical protein